MRNPLSLLYHLLSWLILVIVFVSLFIFFLLESPSTLFKALEKPLKKEGIEYGKIEGSLLSGFIVHDLNYKEQVKVNSVALKFDLHQLENRILYIDELNVSDVEIDKDFLASMVEVNASTQESNETSINLPFDKVIVDELLFSLQNTSYDKYHIKNAKLSVKNFETDMKKEHKGEVLLLLNSNVTQIDLDAKIVNNKFQLKANVEGEKSFISPMLEEYKLTLLSSPKVDIEAKGDLKKVDFTLKGRTLDAKYGVYEARTEALKLDGYYDLEKQDIKVNLHSKVEANVASLKMDMDAFVNLKDVNQTLVFELNTKLIPKKKLIENSLIKKELEKQNIKIDTFPNIDILAKGDMKDTDFKVNVQKLKMSYDKIDIDLEDFDLEGAVSPLRGDTKVKLLTHFDTSVAKGELLGSSDFNFNDLEKSLKFDVKTKLIATKKLTEYSLIKKELEKQNIKIDTFPNIDILAKGDMKDTDFKVNVQKLKMSYDKIDIDLKDFDLEGEVSPLRGDTKVKLLTHFDTSVAKGEILGSSDFNFNDLEKSLNFEVKTDLLGYDAYLNDILKEHNMTIKGSIPLYLTAKGTMTKLKLETKASSTLFYEGIETKVNLKTKEIEIDLEKELVEGALSLNAKGKKLALNLESDFSGEYLNPKKLLSDSSLKISKFNALEINLGELTPLNLKILTSNEGLNLDISSKKLQTKLLSRDYNTFDFVMKSDAIYPHKIVKLPKELKGKFIKLDLKGDVSLKEQYFNVKGLLEANKKFKLEVDALSNREGLKATLFTKELEAEIKGDLKSKNINAKLKVDSLAKLQKEFLALYKFEPLKVEGGLRLNGTLRGEKVEATLVSEKLDFVGFAIGKLLIDAHYEKELLSIKKLNFETIGFKDSSLNQKFYLNQTALVSLGEEKKLLLDMHPKILIKGNGKEENLKAIVQIEDLPLGYPAYGKTRLSCDIDYIQTGSKKKIIGGIFLDKLKVFYESKFLDPSRDNDVVIVSKNKKLKELNDVFLNDTFIDLGIYSKEAEYKTKDIDLKFNTYIKAQKSFGKALKLLGKVDEISGRVEQSPKFFTVVDSSIVFQGREEINPLLDLTIEHELTDILITINVHGNAKRPKITFSSEPPLPKKDILSYLLLGVSSANLGKNQGSLGREVQLFIMNQAARDLAYEVELDRVFVKDDGTGEGYAVQVGKKINEDTMFIIENSTEGNSFILEYDVSKNIKIEVGQHQKTVPSQSIDIYFRKKFK